MLHPSYDVIDVGTCAELRLALDGVAFSEELPHVGFGVRYVAESEGAVPTRFNACGKQSPGKPFGAEAALFHHTTFPAGNCMFNCGFMWGMGSRKLKLIAP